MTDDVSNILPVRPAPAASERFRLGRRPCLDGLRGAAIIMVVLTHFQLFVGGVVGLEILFVLSGFLITVMLIDEWERTGSVSLRAFFRRRFARVLPPLAALLVVGSAVDVALGFATPRQALGDAATAGLFLQNGFASFGGANRFGHTWSLALEVQFYLVWAPAFWLLLRAGFGRGRILAFLALLIATAVAVRTTAVAFRPKDAASKDGFIAALYMRPEYHCETLLIGCLAGAVVGWGRMPACRGTHALFRAAGWCSLSLLAAGAMRLHYGMRLYHCGGQTVVGGATAVLIIWVMRGPPRWLLGVLECRPLVAAGRISYALYLYHMPVILWLEQQSLRGKLLGITLSAAAAALSYLTIERQVTRTRRPLLCAASIPSPASAGRRAA